LPAITFIKSWLPLFFVPPLVVIPLKYHLVQGKILKFLSVIIIGGLMSMTSSALCAQLLSTSRADGTVTKSQSTKQNTPSLPSPNSPIAALILIVLIGECFATC
jgi:hypothetical protein